MDRCPVCHFFYSPRNHIHFYLCYQQCCFPWGLFSSCVFVQQSCFLTSLVFSSICMCFLKVQCIETAVLPLDFMFTGMGQKENLMFLSTAYLVPLYSASDWLILIFCRMVIRLVPVNEVPGRNQNPKRPK